MNKAELINELVALNEKYNRFIEINDYIDNKWNYETASALDKFNGETKPLDGVPKVFKNLPVFPKIKEESVNKLYAAYQESKKLLMYIGLPTAACTLLFFITHKSFLSTIAAVGILVTILFAVKFSTAKKKYELEKGNYEGQLRKYNDSLETFNSTMADFPTEKSNGIRAAKEYIEYYASREDLFQKTFEECEAKKKALINEGLEIGDVLTKNTVIHIDYMKYLPKLISYLGSGRADDLKEAINLAISEEREELERAQRMQEEARRTELLERQIEEERRHNEAMEHQAAMQVQYMKDQADQQARAQAKAEREAWRAQAEAESKARTRCQKCANRMACRGGIPNCGAFVADAAHRLH